MKKKIAKMRYPTATRDYDKLVPILWRDKSKPQSYFNRGFCLEISKSPSGKVFLDLTDNGDTVTFTPWGAHGGKLYKASDIEWEYIPEKKETEPMYPGA